MTVQLSLAGDRGTARIGERDYPFRILAWQAESGVLEIGDRRLRFYWTKRQQAFSLWVNGHFYQLVRAQPQGTAAAPRSEADRSVTAPMPGTIIQVPVREGDRVAAQQPLIVIESMKMESVLRAPRAAVVAKVDCRPGDVVEMGKVLMILEASDGQPAG